MAEYDDFLSYLLADAAIVPYIQRSHEIQSHVSPVQCYLMRMLPTGSVVGALGYIPVASWDMGVPPYSFVLWSGTGGHPDLRLWTDGVRVRIDSVPASRIPAVEDLRTDNQFAVVKRYDLDTQQVEVHLNPTFDPTGHTVEYQYDTMDRGVRESKLNRPFEGTFAWFGWDQYKAVADNWRKANQILVRFPITTADQLVVNAEGRVVVEEHDCWMVNSPYVHDGDLLVVPADQVPHGGQVWLEVVNKRDSVIRNTLVSQRFRVKLVPLEDERTQLPIATTYP